MTYDEWFEATRTIREWVRGGTVSNTALADELAFWLEEIDKGYVPKGR